MHTIIKTNQFNYTSKWFFGLPSNTRKIESITGSKVHVGASQRKIFFKILTSIFFANLHTVSNRTDKVMSLKVIHFIQVPQSQITFGTYLVLVPFSVAFLALNFCGVFRAKKNIYLLNDASKKIFSVVT